MSRSRRWLGATLATTLAMLVPSLQSALADPPPPILTALPRLVPGRISTARGISNDGTAIVGSAEDASQQRGVSWRMTNAPVPVGQQAVWQQWKSEALACNGDGTIIVGNASGIDTTAAPQGVPFTVGVVWGYLSPTGAPNYYPGFTYFAENTYTSCSPNTTGNAAIGGYFVNSAAGGLKAVSPVLGPCEFPGRVRDVSEDGYTCVGKRDGFGKGFWWFSHPNPNGPWIDLVYNVEPLPGHTVSDALALSDDGMVVAGKSGLDLPRPIRWALSGGTSDISLPPPPRGIMWGEATIIRPDGQTIGGWYRTSSGERRVFLWTAQRGMFDVLDNIASRGTDVAGWTVTDLVGISADDHVLAANGTAPGQSVQSAIRIDYPRDAGGRGASLGGFPFVCRADLVGLGGQGGPDRRVTADDLVYFLSQFFAGNTDVADIVGLGGSGGPDGLVTVDDLVAYLAAFFAGC